LAVGDSGERRRRSSGGAPAGNLTAVRGWPGLNHVLSRKLPCNPRKVPDKSRSLEKWRRSELDGGGPAAAAGVLTVNFRQPRVLVIHWF
jgi:hypothetical protein